MLKIKFDSNTTVKDRGADHILRELDRIGRGVYVTTGIHQPEGSQLPRWRGEVDGQTAIATYANMQEYGTRHIPARPFMRKTIEHNTRLFLKNTMTGMRKIYNGHGSVLGLLIQNAKSQDMWMKRMIVQLKKPPNSPSTLRRKRRRGRGSNPLIDSGSMLNAVSSHINYPGKRTFLGGLRTRLSRAENKLKGMRA